MTNYKLPTGCGMILIGVGVVIEIFATVIGNSISQVIGMVLIMMGLILFLYGLEMARK